MNVAPLVLENIALEGRHVRDSVLFAVTDLDWPRVRARLERRLGVPFLETP